MSLDSGYYGSGLSFDLANDSETEVENLVRISDACETLDSEDNPKESTATLPPGSATKRKSDTTGTVPEAPERAPKRVSRHARPKVAPPTSPRLRLDSEKIPTKPTKSTPKAKKRGGISASPASLRSNNSPSLPQPYEREVHPGDWKGERFGDIHYVLLPTHLLHLVRAGGKWFFSRTAPMSSCRNRVVGDIHFIPGEVEGFVYFVCCKMEAEYGRGWVSWELGHAHPLYLELILQHSTPDVPPQWAGRQEL
ncbi:hypothetical protein FRC08_008619 [Ceratobasidium sp. 394]|nr:hypothetical protein FRC08_008619 [Ceratobasidium sp. 394]